MVYVSLITLLADLADLKDGLPDLSSLQKPGPSF
jgi:hypothetical protein